jgi:hypothetical protein
MHGRGRSVWWGEEGCVEAQEIEALAMVGATALVGAMATEAWAAARDRAVELFRHHSPDRRAKVETRLEADAALVARAGDAERARGLLVGPWQLELEDFVTRYPDVAEDLAALSTWIRAALPTPSEQWVQNITARDRSVVNAVQHGTQHNHFMDSPGSPSSRESADDESAD